MKNHTICFIFLFFLFYGRVSAQTFSGYIYDKNLHEPVSNAIVYVDGTSFNTISDAEGKFKLTVKTPVSTSFVISHIKYDKLVFAISSGQVPDTIFLQEKITEVEEVFVKGQVKEKYSREKKLKAFRDQFLGVTNGGKASLIKNESDIRLIYDSQRKTLTATANVPILIENKYLGYDIRFDMQEFSALYSDNSLGNSKILNSYYLGTFSFSDISDENADLSRNREKVYENSVNNFVRHLYYGTLDQSGFTLKKDGVTLSGKDCFTLTYTPSGALVSVKKSSQTEEFSALFDHSSINDMLTVREVREESSIPYVDIAYGNRRSQILFQTDSFLIDHSRIVSPVNKIVFTGHMGGQRVGDMFPLDYSPPNQSYLPPKNLTPGNTVFDHFRNQLDVYPQEKIYLHLDRDYFVAGEQIWFKAYLADAATHRTINLSRYVYVELIDPENKLISRVMLRPENGMHYGHIFLSEAVPEGYYTIRAYTSYMNNIGADYFFRKQIRIGSVSMEQSRTTNADEKSPDKDYDVSFFPEGGNLLEGVLCKVAFKALNSDGTSAYVSGTVIDEKGKVQALLETRHAGMGVFGFVPEKGQVYYADCTDQNGKAKRFRLPEAQQGAYSLLVTRGGSGQLYIGRRKSADKENFPVSNLLIHCRGTVLYAGTWDSSKKNWAFSESELPSGVIHILLLDKEMNPLSERLVFCRNEDQAQLSFSTDKEAYAIRDQVTCELFVTDSDGVPLAGNYSVSVTDDKDQALDHSVSILSTLLLTSDLRGYIDSPEYYFQNTNEESIQLLDCLMLTHGWRRYNVPELVKGNFVYPQRSMETSLAVSGKTTTLLTGHPARNTLVSLTSMSTGEIFQTTATDTGNFVFDGLEFSDSTKLFLRSEKAKGSTSVELWIDEKTFPSLNALAIKSDVSGIVQERAKPTILEEERGTFIKKASERYKYDDEMRTIHLQNIEVVASKQNKDPKPYSVFSKLADVSIGLAAIEERNPATMLDVFSSVPGITPVVGEDLNDITLLFRGTDAAAIYINDVYMSPDMGSPLSMLSPQDIERIDVFRPGAGSGIYGLLGANGVVNITTKRGGSSVESEKKVFHQKTITPLGYQKPVAFYSPRYDTQEQKFDIKPDLRTTVFWKPDIVTAQDGKTSFDFYTSDFSTTYSVVIEGLTNDGRIIRDIQEIVVK